MEDPTYQPDLGKTGELSSPVNTGKLKCRPSASCADINNIINLLSKDALVLDESEPEPTPTPMQSPTDSCNYSHQGFLFLNNQPPWISLRQGCCNQPALNAFPSTSPPPSGQSQWPSRGDIVTPELLILLRHVCLLLVFCLRIWSICRSAALPSTSPPLCGPSPWPSRRETLTSELLVLLGQVCLLLVFCQRILSICRSVALLWFRRLTAPANDVELYSTQSSLAISGNPAPEKDALKHARNSESKFLALAPVQLSHAGLSQREGGRGPENHAAPKDVRSRESSFLALAPVQRFHACLCQSEGGRASSSKSQNGGSKVSGAQKRTRQQAGCSRKKPKHSNQDDGQDDGEDEPGSNSRKAPNGGGGSKEKEHHGGDCHEIPCPYGVVDPEGHKTCVRMAFEERWRLKEHLERKHMRFVCPDCHQAFEGDKKWLNHRHSPDCHRHPDKAQRDYRLFFDQEQGYRLKRKRRGQGNQEYFNFICEILYLSDYLDLNHTDPTPEELSTGSAAAGQADAPWFGEGRPAAFGLSSTEPNNSASSALEVDTTLLSIQGGPLPTDVQDPIMHAPDGGIELSEGRPRPRSDPTLLFSALASLHPSEETSTEGVHDTVFSQDPGYQSQAFDNHNNCQGYATFDFNGQGGTPFDFNGEGTLFTHLMEEDTTVGFSQAATVYNQILEDASYNNSLEKESSGPDSSADHPGYYFTPNS